MISSNTLPSPPKIIFFDIDDTLYVKAQHTVPASVFSALKQLKANGIQLAIATGRGKSVFPKQIYQLIDEVGMDLIVSINGQCCHYHGELLADFPLQAQDVTAVTKLLIEQNMSYAYMTAENIFAMHEDIHLQAALGALQIAYTPMRLVDFDSSQPIYQILAFHENNSHIQLQLPASLKTVRWHYSGIDILDANGSKARGIAHALAALGLTFEDTWAFGDGLNDVEMLQAVGFGIAMGNAHPALQAVADYVCPNAWDDGILLGLKSTGLI